MPTSCQSISLANFLDFHTAAATLTFFILLLLLHSRTSPLAFNEVIMKDAAGSKKKVSGLMKTKSTAGV